MAGRRSFTRKSGFRDSRLIIIATEGEETEKVYFEGLKNYYSNPRVHIQLLNRLSSASDPERILKNLDQFYSTYNLRKNYDQLWLVIDVDHWGNSKLACVSKLCFQKSYCLAISNPAFEIWLLMHIHPLDTYSPDVLLEFLNNRKTGRRSRLEIELINLLGSYNKSNPNMKYFSPRAKLAINNARIADDHPEDRWPNGVGTRVYLLVEQIIS